jgi:uncharacterized membrane protein HdeD (DUF308 family)
MTEQRTDIDMVQVRRSVAENWGWFVGFGIVLIVIGTLAILFPVVSTIATSITFGWLLMVSGILGIIHAFRSRGWEEVGWSGLIGLLWLITGFVIAFFPLAGAFSLTVLLAAVFIVEGVIEMIWANRTKPGYGWQWVLVSGAVALLVGILIAAGLPSTALWAVGLLMGVNLLFSGWSFLFLGLAGRRAEQRGA